MVVEVLLLFAPNYFTHEFCAVLFKWVHLRMMLMVQLTSSVQFPHRRNSINHFNLLRKVGPKDVLQGLQFVRGHQLVGLGSK